MNKMAPMHVKNVRDVPEYEIDPQEIDFSNSVNITKVTHYFFCGGLCEYTVSKFVYYESFAS